MAHDVFDATGSDVLLDLRPIFPEELQTLKELLMLKIRPPALVMLG